MFPVGSTVVLAQVNHSEVDGCRVRQQAACTRTPQQGAVQPLAGAAPTKTLIPATHTQ